MFTYKKAPYKIFFLRRQILLGWPYMGSSRSVFLNKYNSKHFESAFFFSFNHSQGKNIKYNENINKMETNYLVLVG